MKNTIPYTYLIGWTSLNKYYYGRRTAENCNPTDFWKTYFTSSTIVSEFVKTHGEPDLVEIRKIFDNDADLKSRIIQCANWENRFLTRVRAARNPKFLNKSNGDAKFDASGMATVIDTLTGETKQVLICEFNASDRYKGIGVGTVAVTIRSSGKSTKVSTTEYHTNKHLYKHHSSGFITVTEIFTGKKIKIDTEKFHNNRDLYHHHSDGCILSKESRKKISIGNTDKPKSESHKQNISKSLTGKKKTPEHIANSKKNRKPPFKSVIVNGVYFQSVSAAASHFNVHHSTISNILAGRKKLSVKFWEVQYANPYLPPIIS